MESVHLDKFPVADEAAIDADLEERMAIAQKITSMDQQTFLQVPRIDDRKPVFVSSDVRDRLDRVVRILGGRRMSADEKLEKARKTGAKESVICGECKMNGTVIQRILSAWNAEEAGTLLKDDVSSL